MIDKFGDCSSLEDLDVFSNLQSIRKIIKISGKYKDYIDEIESSIRLGYVPFRISTDKSPSYLYIFNKNVWCIGSPGKIAERVTDESITKEHFLVYWIDGTDDTVTSFISALQGPPGEIGPRGKRGVSGSTVSIGLMQRDLKRM